MRQAECRTLKQLTSLVAASMMYTPACSFEGSSATMPAAAARAAATETKRPSHTTTDVKEAHPSPDRTRPFMSRITRRGSEVEHRDLLHLGKKYHRRYERIYYKLLHSIAASYSSTTCRDEHNARYVKRSDKWPEFPICWLICWFRSDVYALQWN